MIITNLAREKEKDCDKGCLLFFKSSCYINIFLLQVPIFLVFVSIMNSKATLDANRIIE